VAKYRVATPTTPKVIGAQLLKFKPISDFPLKKIVSGTPVPGVGVQVRQPFSSACKNWEGGAARLKRPKYGFLKKSIWVGMIPHRDLHN